MAISSAHLSPVASVMYRFSDELVPKAAEATQGKSPRSTTDTMPVGADTGAKMAGADVLVPEETHDCGCVMYS